MVEGDSLLLKRCESSGVIEDVIAERNLSCIGHLGGKPGTCIGRGGAGSGEEARDLLVVRRGDEDELVKPATPAGSGAPLVRLKDEGRLDDCDSGGIVSRKLAQPGLLRGDNRRVDELIELSKAALLKCEAGKMLAVEAVAGGESGRSEVGQDCFKDRLAGLHELAGEFVGLKYAGAKRGEDAGGGGFTTGEAAGEANAEHVAKRGARGGAGRRARYWP